MEFKLPNYLIDHKTILDLQKLSKLIITINDEILDHKQISSSHHQGYRTVDCWSEQDLISELKRPNRGRAYILLYLNAEYELVIAKNSILLTKGSAISRVILIYEHAPSQLMHEITKHINNEPGHLTGPSSMDYEDFLKHNPGFVYHLDILQSLNKG